jgi:hypothetical protein
MADNQLLTEMRRPGAPMRPCPIKLPPDRLEQLHRQAQRLNCYPSALCRALVVAGLDRLEQEVA